MAQRAFFEKAQTESLGASVKAKLLSAAAELFGSVGNALRRSDELVKHVEGETSMFQKGDKAWFGRVCASELYCRALADEQVAEDRKAEFDYGQQVPFNTNHDRDSIIKFVRQQTGVIPTTNTKS